MQRGMHYQLGVVSTIYGAPTATTNDEYDKADDRTNDATATRALASDDKTPQEQLLHS